MAKYLVSNRNVIGPFRRYRHLYEAEKRSQAARLEALMREHLDASWTDEPLSLEEALNEAAVESGRLPENLRDSKKAPKRPLGLELRSGRFRLRGGPFAPAALIGATGELETFGHASGYVCVNVSSASTHVSPAAIAVVSPGCVIRNDSIAAFA